MGEKLKEREPEVKILKRIEYEGGEAVVRYPKEGDIDGILETVLDKREMWKKEGKKKDVQQVDEKEREFREKIIKASQDGRMVQLVVEADGKVRGYVDIRRNVDKAKDPLEMGKTDDSRATVMDLTVHSKYRGKRFGVELMQAGIEEAKNVLNPEVLELETDEDNYALKIYERCGFKEKTVGATKKQRVDKTVDRVAMELAL